MRCYQVRVLKGDDVDVVEVICADDERAFERAAALAHGRRFELWRGGQRLYAHG